MNHFDDRAWEKVSNNKWKYVDGYGYIFATVEANENQTINHDIPTVETNLNFVYTNVDDTVKVCMLRAERALLAISNSITTTLRDELEDKTRHHQRLMQLHDKGAITARQLLDGLGLDYDEEVKRMRDAQKESDNDS